MLKTARTSCNPAGLGAGFTLSELLVTLALVGVLLALAIPWSSALAERQRLKQAAEAVAGELDKVRLEASRRDADLTVSFNTGADWCYGVDDTGSCNCATPGDCAIASVAGSTLATDVTLDSASFAGSVSYTTFDRVRGTAGAGNVQMSTSSGFDLQVKLSGRGRTRICSPSDNVVGYPQC